MPSGARNGRWNGGQWVNSKGYVMVLVGKTHPMATCRAYAPRCRVVLYDTYGPPSASQQAHHKNKKKQDDRAENLEWTHSTKHGQIHLTSSRAREIGRLGGLATARKRGKSR